jgi:hypothetical protein
VKIRGEVLNTENAPLQFFFLCKVRKDHGYLTLEAGHKRRWVLCRCLDYLLRIKAATDSKEKTPSWVYNPTLLAHGSCC